MIVWKRNLTMLWLSQLLVMAGFDAMSPFIPLFLKNGMGLTDTAQLAKFIAFYNIGAFVGYGIANPLWGWLGDRYGMKPMLLRGTFLTSVFWPMMAYATSPWTVVALRSLTAFLAGTTAASQIMIARTTPVERQGFAQGTLTTAFWGGSLLGNVAGGLVIHHSDYRTAFWLCGILYFLAGLFIFFTEDPVEREMSVAAANPRPWWRRISCPKLPGAVWGVIGLFMLMGICRRIEVPFVSLRVEQLVGVQSADYWTGIVSAAVGVGAILSGVFFGYLIDRYPPRLLLPFILLGTALFTFLQGVWDGLAVFGITRTLAYFLAGALQPMLQKWLAIATPQNHRGIAFGLASTALSIGGSVAALVGATLMRKWGVPGIFIGASIAMAVGYPLFHWGMLSPSPGTR